MLEYVVKVAWKAEFIFNNGPSAFSFAQTAASKKLPEYDNEDITIVIRRKEEVKEDEQND